MSQTADRLQITRHEVMGLINIEPILKRLNLSLYCMKCHAQGRPDGVRANNSESDAELIVECGCTTRVYSRGYGRGPVNG